MGVCVCVCVCVSVSVTVCVCVSVCVSVCVCVCVIESDFLLLLLFFGTLLSLMGNWESPYLVGHSSCKSSATHCCQSMFMCPNNGIAATARAWDL